MLTKDEALFCAKIAENYPTGYGHSYFCHMLIEFADAAAEIAVEHAECGCPSLQLAVRRARNATEDDIEEALNEVTKACGMGHKAFCNTLDKSPKAIAGYLLEYAMKLPS